MPKYPLSIYIIFYPELLLDTTFEVLPKAAKNIVGKFVKKC
jgi:hypothetical protein